MNKSHCERQHCMHYTYLRSYNILSIWMLIKYLNAYESKEIWIA